MLVQIAGHLGADPETKFTPTGKKVTTLRVAVNIKRSNKEETVWWRVTIWGDEFDRMMPYLKKGSAVFIIGDMSPARTYQGRDGQTQVSHEVTAKYIGFNPFGKNDKTGAEGQGQQDGSAQESDSFMPASGYTPAASYSSPSAQQYQPRPAPAGGSMGGMMPGSQAADFGDDEIPF